MAVSPPHTDPMPNPRPWSTARLIRPRTHPTKPNPRPWRNSICPTPCLDSRSSLDTLNPFLASCLCQLNIAFNQTLMAAAKLLFLPPITSLCHHSTWSGAVECAPLLLSANQLSLSPHSARRCSPLLLTPAAPPPPPAPPPAPAAAPPFAPRQQLPPPPQQPPLAPSSPEP